MAARKGVVGVGPVEACVVYDDQEGQAPGQGPFSGSIPLAYSFGLLELPLMYLLLKCVAVGRGGGGGPRAMDSRSQRTAKKARGNVGDVEAVQGRARSV